MTLHVEIMVGTFAIIPGGAMFAVMVRKFFFVQAAFLTGSHCIGYSTLPDSYM